MNSNELLASQLEAEIYNNPEGREQSITLAGKTLYLYSGNYLTLTAIAKDSGLNPRTLSKRIRIQGFKENDNIRDYLYPTESASNQKLHTVSGESLTMTQWSEKSGISYSTLYARLHYQRVSMSDAIAGIHKPKKKRQGNPFIIPESKFEMDLWIKNTVKSLKKLGLKGKELEMEAIKRVRTTSGYILNV